MKTCSRCNVEQPLGDFHIDKRSGKPRSYCKGCQRQLNAEWRERNKEKVLEKNKEYQLKHKLKNRYNLSEEEYQEAVVIADGKCAICRKDEKLFIDHCHETEKFRGLLCTRCNTGLGMFWDDIDNLQRAAGYLSLGPMV
jgi:hypothetical protein